VGYTTSEHLLLDLDDTSLYKVTRLIQILQQSYPELGNALIMHSSTRKAQSTLRINRHGIPKEVLRRESYHVVFNNRVTYARCCEVTNTLVDLNILEPEYRVVRAKRGDMTIRVSPMLLSKGIKPEPKPYRTILSPYSGRQHGMIKQYLAFLYATRNLFLD